MRGCTFLTLAALLCRSAGARQAAESPNVVVDDEAVLNVVQAESAAPIWGIKHRVPKPSVPLESSVTLQSDDDAPPAPPECPVGPPEIDIEINAENPT